MELESRAKRLYDVTGKPPVEEMTKGVLVGMLDKVTKAHLGAHLGEKTSAMQLKQLILEYVNNVTAQTDRARGFFGCRNG